MPKNIEKDKEKLKEKLEYIGLNLEKIPKFLTEFTPFSFKPSKTYDDTSYKIYKHLDVNKIQILLTPTNRLNNLNEKYKLAVPLLAYLDSKSEDGEERFSTFLKLINDTQIEEIREIEVEQEKLKNEIPYLVKYSNNYMWQIYYSDVSNEYFMLVPTNETKNAALLYLLKKQIEAKKTRKRETIFVPISHQEYSGSFLVKSQITDLENYLWYFTKDWPNIYEVYNQKNKMSIKIVGKTNIYKNIKSDYVITLNSKEEALEKYKLIKALFILATGLPEDYKFKTNINDGGDIEFIYTSTQGEQVISYEKLLNFIQEQVNQKRILLGLEDKRITEVQEQLKNLKQTIEEQTEEFQAKQRQIATFLECKKTFFGKVKYYFANRKKQLKVVSKPKASNNSNKTENTTEQKYMENAKFQYTIEDLIEICTKLDGRTKVVKNLNLDVKALELKKVNLERKIKNANIYLNEIELHKKSIFEFWKFSNKDELPSLGEGENEDELQKEKISKQFSYEEDMEELGKKVDELQRRKLSKNEIDSIFAIKQALVSCQIINKDKEQTKKLEEELKKLQADYEKDIDIVQLKDFDIFGGMSDDKTKIKELNNQKHREIEKDKYKVLNITKNTELSVYIDNLTNYLKLLKEAFCKINTLYDMSIYLTENKELDKNNLQIFHLDENKAMTQNLEHDEIYLYKVNLEENMPILYYSNIVFFDNFNQTLPIGMDLSDEVLIDLKKYTLTKAKEENFKFNYVKDEYTNKIIKVNVIEYNAKINKKRK